MVPHFVIGWDYIIPIAACVVVIYLLVRAYRRAARKKAP